jgi:lipoprotein-anchoring transpeptidase ErfK/SrfK
VVSNAADKATQRAVRARVRGLSTAGALTALAAVTALGLSACSSGSSDTPTTTQTVTSGPSQPGTSGSSAATTPPAPKPPATVAANVAANTTSLSPTDPIRLTAAGGRLTAVKLVNPDGKLVSGALAANGSSWHNTEDLGYSKTYRLTAVAVNADGAKTTKRMKLNTLTPDNMTMPYLDTVYGSAIVNGATYGVGMIPVVHFDEPITDKRAAMKTLSVTTSPHVDGAWYWQNDTDVHWRPRNFYQPGTKVTVSAKVYGAQVSDGLYGQADQSVSYRIGEKRVSVANAETHHDKVYFNDKLVRTMPTSMCQGGTTTGKDGQTIYLWTMPGTYTVIGHENPAIMSSDSYGLPADSPLGYGKEKVYWSTKISTDGIYLHELDTTVWAQGSENVSHGCLNLNHDNAQWYFTHSRVGDIVRVVHSGGPKLEQWQGGDWSVPWSEWQKGGTLSS